MRVYTKAEIKRKQAYHKLYNHRHDYSTKETSNTRFTDSERYIIWHRKLEGGEAIIDPQIAKLLHRSLQSIQLKRCKMKKGEL